MNMMVKRLVATCLFLGLIVSAATPETYYLSDDVEIDAEEPVSLSLENEEGEAFSVTRSGEGTEDDPWVFDLSTLDPAVTTFDMRDHKLYCARDGEAEQGYFVFNLSGAAISGTGATSFRTWRGEEHANADNLTIVNVGDITMGGIDTRVTRPGGYSSTGRRAGDITIGTADKPAGPIRVSFLYAHHDSEDGNHDTVGGHVTIHSTDDVLIVDDAGEAGDIQTQSGRLCRSGNVTVKHTGDFRVNSVNTRCRASTGRRLHSGHIRLNGGDASGDAVVEGDLITSEDQRSSRITEIEIENYNDVSIAGSIDGRSNAGRTATLVKIENNIAGDIVVEEEIDLRETDGGTYGKMRLSAGGDVSILMLDLDKVGSVYMDGAEWPIKRNLEETMAATPGEPLTLGPVVLRDPVGDATWQWYFNDEPIPGATEAELTIPDMTADHVGVYHVVLDDERPMTPLESARVRIEDWPVWETELAAVQSASLGESVTLGPVELFAARGEVTWQWYLDGEPIEGATASSLELENVGADDLGQYKVRVNDELERSPVYAEVRLAEPDWPMWGYDAQRSFRAPVDHLPETLHLQWTRELAPPRRAWPPQMDDRDNLEFDVSYSPVVLGDTLFVNSMTSDRLTAYDLETGAERWRYYADGPVRLAPAAWDGKVYFVSDDGRLYCLDAETGTKRWAFNAAPTDHRVLGNERVVSFWPARGAPVIKDGTVYFASGVWPFLGTFVFALDAETGEQLWANTGHATEWQKQPHSGAYSFAGLAPQGYLAASDDFLVVSGGRAFPGIFDRHAGILLHVHATRSQHTSAGGGYRVRIEDDSYFDHDSDPRPLPCAKTGSIPKSSVQTEAFYRRLYPLPAPDGGTVWDPTPENDDEADAEDLADDADDNEGDPDETDDRRIALLERAQELEDHLDGPVFEALVARDRFFVVTEKGTIYCFGAEPRDPFEHAYAPAVPEPRDDAVGRRAESLLDRSGHRRGYALFLGAGDGDLMEQVAVRSELHIVAIERDTDRIAALRQRFDEAGLYGSRIALLPGDPMETPYPPYISSLVVVEDATELGRAPDVAFLEFVYERLRPYNGHAELTTCARTEEAFAEALAEFEPENGRAENDDGTVTLRREGPLPGSGQWTHQYADAGQSNQSGDQRVRAPLGPVWFGGPDHYNVLPRHGRGPRPQVAGGRVVLLGPETVSARCVFTGRELWVRVLPGIGHSFTVRGDRVKPEDRVRRWEPGRRSPTVPHAAGAKFRGSPFVSLPDSIYVLHAGHVLRLDPDTGESLGEWPLYDEDEQEDAARDRGGHISVSGDVVVASLFPDVFDGRPGRSFNDTSSRGLTALDRFTGEQLWTRNADMGFRHNAIVSGNGILFVNDFISEVAVEAARVRGMEVEEKPRLLALDLRTGNELWSIEDEGLFGTFLSYCTEHDVLIEGGAGRGARGGPPNEPGNQLRTRRGRTGETIWELKGLRGRNPLVGPYILRGEDLFVGGRAYSLLTGERRDRNRPVFGGETELSYSRRYGCGHAIAGMHLLTFRSGAAGFYDLERYSGTGNVGGIRSGCTQNLIPADGILNAPDYTRTCTCAYQNQTSLGLVHMPELEQWTYDQSVRFSPGTREVIRMGVNLGAPGDRLDENKTLWMPFPHTAYNTRMPLELDADNYFRKHALLVDGENGLNWVAASGARNVRSFELETYGDDRPYRVTLHFSEPDRLSPGERVFDIAIEGAEPRKAFDVVAAAGGPDRAVTVSFRDVPVGRTLRIRLSPTDDSEHPPVLSGVELVREAEKEDE